MPLSLMNRLNQTASAASCVKIVDAVFPKDLFSDYLDIIRAVAVPCTSPKGPPHTSI